MVDHTGEFNDRSLVSERLSVGPLDRTVDFYAEKYKRDVRPMRAAVCDLVMRHLRSGIAATNSAILVSPTLETNAMWAMSYPDFAPRKGIEWQKIKGCLQEMRQHKKHDSDMPSDDGNPVLKFTIHALKNACHDSWWTSSSQTARDIKNTNILARNYVAQNEKYKGYGYRRLMDPLVFAAARVEFAGIFSAVEGEPFVFADGRTNRPNLAFVNIAANAPATGQGSTANANVLLSQANQLRSILIGKMATILEFVDDIAGIQSETDAITLPGPVHDVIQPFFDVSVESIPMFLTSAIDPSSCLPR